MRTRTVLVAVCAAFLASAGLALPASAVAAPACTITGTNGPEFLYGTSGRDVICGLGGNDTIYGGAGHDIIYGGAGSDRLYGGAGNDSIHGNGGTDFLRGGTGNDSLHGQGGSDFLSGEAGSDRLRGGAGNDSIFGGAGSDRLYGGAGNDSIFGSKGSDRLYGGPGNDVLRGGPGNDALAGYGGDDRLIGGPGNDSLWGGGGADVLNVTGGRDTIEFPDDRDTVIGGAASTPPPPSPAAGPARWTDPEGDQEAGAPDITTVTVSDTDDGLLTISIETPSDRYLTEGTLVLVSLDTDEPHGLADYWIHINGDTNTAVLTTSQGPIVKASLRWSWDYGPTVTLNLRDIGNPREFSFHVFSRWWRGDGDYEAYSDQAPDFIETVWNYQVGSATATPPPGVVGSAFKPRDIYNQPSRTHSPGSVVVHYVTSGPDAPPPADSDRDGTPDYVEEVAQAAELSLKRFAALGFRPPSPDTWGPDAMVDIYLKDIDSRDDRSAGKAFSFGHKDGGYAIVESDVMRITDSFRALVAHELFHLVQFAYVPRGIPCWVGEGTAEAAETMVYPDGDFRASNWRTEAWLKQPWRPLTDDIRDGNRDFCYAGRAWFQFLHKRDSGLLRAYFELLSTGGGPVKALDQATRRRGLGTAGLPYAQFATAIWNHGHTVYTWATVRPTGNIVATDDWTARPLAAYYVPVESAHDCRVGLRVEGQVDALLVVDGRTATPTETAPGRVTFIEDICTSGYRPSDNVMLIVTAAGAEQARWRVVHEAGTAAEAAATGTGEGEAGGRQRGQRQAAGSGAAAAPAARAGAARGEAISEP